MKILAFSDWRVQDIEQFVDYLEKLEEKPDIIVYAGDDIGRFNQVLYRALPKDLRRKYREELIKIEEPFGKFDRKIIEDIIYYNEIEYSREVNKFEEIATFSKHGLCVVAGNDDPPYRKKAINGRNVYDIHSNPIIIDNFAIIGIEGSTGEIGRLLYTEKQIKAHLNNKIKQVGDKHLIIVSHSHFRGMDANDVFVALASEEFPMGNEYLKGWLTAKYLKLFGEFSKRTLFVKYLDNMGIKASTSKASFYNFRHRELLYEHWQRKNYIPLLRFYASFIIKDHDTIYGFLHHLGLLPETFTSAAQGGISNWELENIVIDIFGFDFDIAKDIYSDHYFGRLQILISGD